MRIYATQYSAENRAIEIYLSGCDGICKGCHNPELWDFNMGTEWQHELPKIINKIRDFDPIIDNIWILGGEPLLQNISHLKILLRTLKQDTNKKLWLFTRFNHDVTPIQIKYYCDYIKHGAYVEELKCDNNIQYGIKLATSNQYIKYYGRE